MESRVVLVAGSSSGIGRAIAHRFAKNGDQVVVHASSCQEKCNKVVDECNALSPNNMKALGLVHDFKEPREAYKLVERAIDSFNCVDVLVFSIGVLTSAKTQNFMDLYDQYLETRAIELDAAINIGFYASEKLKNSKKCPSIVFIGGTETYEVDEISSVTCKSAVDKFAKCLAKKCGPHIRVNIVNPGGVETAIMEEVKRLFGQEKFDEAKNKHLLQRFAQPEEIAEAVFFLASDKAAFVTGTGFNIDGGYSLNI